MINRIFEEIRAERWRQNEEKGFTAEHDDKWNFGEMATAAAKRGGIKR